MAGNTYDPFAGQDSYDYVDWYGDPMTGSFDQEDLFGTENVVPLYLGFGDPNEEIAPIRKSAPQTFSQAFSFMDKLTRPVKAPPQVNYDKLLDAQTAKYERSLGDADTANTYGLNLYEDPRTAAIVQGYVNDLQSGKITPEEAIRNFNYRTGATGKDGNPRVKEDSNQSLYLDMLGKAGGELDKRRAGVWKSERRASEDSFKWMNENMRGLTPEIDKFLDEWAPRMKEKGASGTTTNDRFAREARKFVAGLSKDDVGERLTKYGKDPKLDAKTYVEAAAKLRGIDPRLDRFFDENRNAAQTVTNPGALKRYTDLIAELSSPQAAARRRGLPTPEAPGDLEGIFRSPQGRAAMLELFNQGGRARQQLDRMPTPRQQYQRYLDAMRMVVLGPRVPKG